jgi:hypothetical protein
LVRHKVVRTHTLTGTLVDKRLSHHSAEVAREFQLIADVLPIKFPTELLCGSKNVLTEVDGVALL